MTEDESMGAFYRDVRDARTEKRRSLGRECPQCHILRPKTNASILLPGQRCKVDGYRDPRLRLDQGAQS
jgi:hypothetical protein